MEHGISLNIRVARAGPPDSRPGQHHRPEEASIVFRNSKSGILLRPVVVSQMPDMDNRWHMLLREISIRVSSQAVIKQSGQLY